MFSISEQNMGCMVVELLEMQTFYTKVARKQLWCTNSFEKKNQEKESRNVPTFQRKFVFKKSRKGKFYQKLNCLIFGAEDYFVLL